MKIRISENVFSPLFEGLTICKDFSDKIAGCYR